MSTHNIPIIEIGEIEKHPNADTLGIVRIKGWQTCIKLDQFKNGDKAIWIEPDYNVPLNHPSFTFLKNKNNDGKTFERIRVRRFCKALSQGLMIPVPDDLKDLPVGTDVIEQLGIERWEPPIESTSYAMFDGGPSSLYAPMFDVENWQNFPEVFNSGETVIATEKLHGCLRFDTKIRLINGEEILISEIKKGDRILSFNLNSQLFEMDEVIGIFERELDKSWIRLEFDNFRTIHCTEDHLFLTKKGWVEAKNLSENDEFVEN